MTSPKKLNARLNARLNKKLTTEPPSATASIPSANAQDPRSTSDGSTQNAEAFAHCLEQNLLLQAKPSHALRTWLKVSPEALPQALQAPLISRPTSEFVNSDSEEANFPLSGAQPQNITTTSLEWMHPAITECCLCVVSTPSAQGSSSIGQATVYPSNLRFHWHGRRAFDKVQLWSATKFIPMVQLLTSFGKLPGADELGIMCPSSPGILVPLRDIFSEIIEYTNGDSGSNSLAASLKRFMSASTAEQWIASFTGQSEVEFGGYYGEPPTFSNPRIVLLKSQGTVLATCVPLEPRRKNLCSAYSLTRLVMALGCHWLLPQAARIPGLEGQHAEVLSAHLTLDIARYLDHALHLFGAPALPHAGVVLSKIGAGWSDERLRTEIVYCAFVRLELPKPLCFAVTIKAALVLPGGDQKTREMLELDARMASEVATLVRRLSGL